MVSQNGRRVVAFTTSLLLSSTVGACGAVFPLHDGWLYRLGKAMEPIVGDLLSMWIVYFLLPIAFALGMYDLIVRGFKTQVTETACRKCGYILRGLSEPRCPECGEAI